MKKNIAMFLVFMFVGSSCSMRAQLPANVLEDVVYYEARQLGSGTPGLDRAVMELLFSREPRSPVSSSEIMGDGRKEQVFFFPMVDAVGKGSSRAIRRLNTQSGKVCDIVIEPIEGPELGLKVTLRYDPQELSVVCHIGLEGDRRRARFRLHDKAVIDQLGQFNALRMARLSNGITGYVFLVADGIAVI